MLDMFQIIVGDVPVIGSMQMVKKSTVKQTFKRFFKSFFQNQIRKDDKNEKQQRLSVIKILS